MSIHPLVLIFVVPTVAVALFLIVFVSSIRLLSLLPPYRSTPQKRSRDAPTRILVVLGSGGHTAEMLAMLGKIDVARFSHRTYVVSTGDAFSADKARRFESNLEQRAVEMKRQADASVALEAAKEPDGVPLIPSQVLKKRRLQQDARGSSSSNMKEARESTSADYTIQSLPRARHVHQSIFTTPVTALHSLFVTLRSLRSQPYPDVIITNGPATGVIVILASIILRFFDVRGANSLDKMRTIYVESWARVKTLSLSGKLLVTFADRFLVQWEALDGCANGKGEYRGVLV